MKLFTYKPITFLLSSSVGSAFFDFRDSRFTVISINKTLSLTGKRFVTRKGQQKRIGFLYFKTLINPILHHILVGKDKSVVTTNNMSIPTIDISRISYG